MQFWKGTSQLLILGTVAAGTYLYAVHNAGSPGVVESGQRVAQVTPQAPVPAAPSAEPVSYLSPLAEPAQPVAAAPVAPAAPAAPAAPEPKPVAVAEPKAPPVLVPEPVREPAPVKVVAEAASCAIGARPMGDCDCYDEAKGKISLRLHPSRACIEEESRRLGHKLLLSSADGHYELQGVEPVMAAEAAKPAKAEEPATAVKQPNVIVNVVAPPAAAPAPVVAAAAPAAKPSKPELVSYTNLTGSNASGTGNSSYSSVVQNKLSVTNYWGGWGYAWGPGWWGYYGPPPANGGTPPPAVSQNPPPANPPSHVPVPRPGVPNQPPKNRAQLPGEETPSAASAPASVAENG